jgi:2-desacetyl-2-hydroxyethyl bacteriochlorophyllide A dehydrogenase
LVVAAIRLLESKGNHMGQVAVFVEPRKLILEEVEDRPLGANEVRLRTLYSGISAGTELTAYRGSNPYLHKRWDAGQRLFVPDSNTSMHFPVVGFGYEECGEVVELGASVTRVKLGDIVYGTWGHRTHHVVTEEYAAGRIQPPGLEPMLGIFSQMGAISLNGVLDAAIRIGETVVVFGLGTPGQMVAQLAKRSGARVIGVDPIELRRDMACKLGAVDEALAPADGDVAEHIRALTNNRGADVCIEASGAYPALQEAIRTAAYSAKVVSMGFFQGGGQALYLGEEFHHNRVNVVCSQIYGVSPELTYRWNPDRLVHTFMNLQAQGVLNLRPLITHVLPFSESAEAFRICDMEPQTAVQVVLDFKA